jgi:hypothetical protein
MPLLVPFTFNEEGRVKSVGDEGEERSENFGMCQCLES